MRKPFVEAMLEIADESIYNAEMRKSTINSNKAFRSCGLMPEDKELIVEVDNSRHENEGIPEAPPLDLLSPEDRVDELWVDEFIRIFSDGSVDYPADFRLSRSGAGIFFGKNYP